ncbi:MAG: hypothetical protein QME68_07165, partial [Elusimicrobiota bacterium]|nr:hypothetical protein [Elusimicrobiota bacterium]
MSAIRYKLSLSAEDIPKELVPYFSGVGMIRAEYFLKKHRMYITKPELQKIITDYVKAAANLFSPHDVWYRTIELPVNWINDLNGVDHIMHEDDFMAGTRGIRRSLLYPETFKIELSLVSRLSEKHRNLHLLLPFVYDVKELDMAKRLLREVGYKNKIGMMAEIPAAVLCLETFCDSGIDNITVGLNDLTEFTLASARKLGIYDSSHPAVLKMVAHVSEVGKKYGVETVLGGNISKEMSRIGEQLGFDAITVFLKDVPNIL